MTDLKCSLVFDLDGTLIDSAPDIRHSANMKLAEDGLEPYPLEDVRMMIGGGVGKLIERAYAGRGITLERDDRNRLTDRMIEIYSENACIDTAAYPGADDLLKRCAQDGIPMALCTNKPHAITCTILESLGWYDLFGEIVGGDSAHEKKPGPAPMLKALNGIGADPAKSVVIGDSKADFGAARAVGARVMLVSYGYSKTPVQDLEPDWVIDHLGSVLPTLAAGGM